MGKAFALAGLLILGSSSVLTTAPARAMDDTNIVDCGKAEALMQQAAKMGGAASTTGNVDQDFLVVMRQRDQGTHMLMVVEAKCGKDPKAVAMARKADAAARQRMMLFRKTNSSQ